MPLVLGDTRTDPVAPARAPESVLRRVAEGQGGGTSLERTTSIDPRSSRGVERLRHEYALRESIDSAWGARPLSLALGHGQGRLVLADPGGELLDGFLGDPWEIGAFLRAAIGIAVAVGGAHGAGMIHKDLRPEHVLLDPGSGDAWLTGFGVASRLPRERQSPQLPESLGAMLAYMAPEQTGRMNRSVDTRSDLYALGVILYQMLTGGLPFTATDPMELIHCHIARRPVSPAERDAGIPPPLSAIVMKLLSKTAEERYQTAAGLIADLRCCLAQWRAGGRLEAFEALGRHDRPDRILVPEKLYGREQEVTTLLSAFDRVVRGGPPELMLVSGYSGIGKSSVVAELQRALVPPRGLLASGKFDQYKRDIPYATLAQAFQGLVRGLLARSDAELAPWRDSLRQALGPNGGLMTELVPELVALIGEQPPVPELPAQDARGRFQLVLRRFIDVFARPEHPLAIFLDDLQWLDAATLDLLETVLAHPSDLRNLLLIGAYRDNEVSAAHPLARTLCAIANAGGCVREIALAPLALDDLSRLVADALLCDIDVVLPLAELLQEKTAGNPFFVIQFLGALAEEGLLAFDHQAGRWSWDLGRIHATGYTDNVVELMIGKLSRLPPRARQVLQQLACLGSGAASALLARLCECDEETLRTDMHEAQATGLVFHAEGAYRFLHDRVQEAAYGLIGVDRRADAHLRTGRLLVAGLSVEEREEAIFEIVNQLNRGVERMTTRDEKEQLAGFNLVAGKRAKASTAYVSAMRYLVAGVDLLPRDRWERLPALAFALELQLAECEFLTGNLAEAERRLAELATRAATRVDLATVASLSIDLQMTCGRNDRGVAVCLDYLRQLGVDWPPHPTETQAREKFERTWATLEERGFEAIANLPLMHDADSVATMDVLTKGLTPALYTDTQLLCLFVCQMIELTLACGNTDGSCLAYSWLGRISGSCFGDCEAGFRFGRLGRELVERPGLERFRARTYISFANFCMPWMRHAREGQDLLRRAYEAGHMHGDLTHAAFSFNNLITSVLFTGEPLAEVQAEAERGLAFARVAGFDAVARIISTQLRFVHMLRGTTARFGSLDGEEFDEAGFELDLVNAPAGSGAPIAAYRYWARKLQARFLAGDHSAAVDAARNAQRLAWTLPSMLESAGVHLFGALSHVACLDDASAGTRQEHLEAIGLHHRQLVEWAAHCPENFENSASLVGAEVARVEGREMDAARLYDSAIRSARENGFVQNEAIARELAARFYAAVRLEEIAAFHLGKARAAYARWGADGKVAQLDRAFADLRLDDLPEERRRVIVEPAEQLDLATVIKVSQALSGEIVLEKMLDTLMRLAIEHAGAERGLLILSRAGEQRVAAEVTTDGDAVAVEAGDQPLTATTLPETVFHYVVRTRASVILDDAMAQGAFVGDPYIQARRSRSILCLPLVKQGRLIGVLYLENGLAARVFTPDRLAVLELVASQAAISLENARLNVDLQKAQRLEAMGTLAGGIAHDFNNILGAILGYGEMALHDMGVAARLRRDIEAIMTAGERGRALVDRVLAFSRSGVGERVPVHVEKVVREALELLSGQLPGSVRLETHLAAGRAAVLGDPTQVHQVVMNLCTNAVQAMPTGGKLGVSLDVQRVEGHRAASVGSLDVGEYLVLRVSDTGLGMKPDIAERIFDPFFTTKDPGSGTGLGLALAHGIVTQFDGAIDVVSEPGEGSTFTICLPRSGEVADTDSEMRSDVPRGAGERVLVVDDEEPLARLAVRMLEELGYQPVSFTSSVAALAALRADSRRFDILVTDERMPGLSGCELVREARAIDLALPVILTSGYVSAGLASRAREAGADEVLKKPLRARDLALGLARVLRLRA